jgi:hypothetical protein
MAQFEGLTFTGEIPGDEPNPADTIAELVEGIADDDAELVAQLLDALRRRSYRTARDHAERLFHRLDDLNTRNSL